MTTTWRSETIFNKWFGSYTESPINNVVRVNPELFNLDMKELQNCRL